MHGVQHTDKLKAYLIRLSNSTVLLAFNLAMTILTMLMRNIRLICQRKPWHKLSATTFELDGDQACSPSQLVCGYNIPRNLTVHVECCGKYNRPILEIYRYWTFFYLNCFKCTMTFSSNWHFLTTITDGFDMIPSLLTVYLELLRT